MAPEIVAGRPATAAADVYSLALTLYLVFSGNRSPYEIGPESSPAEWLRAHSEARPRPLRDRAPGAPADVAYLLAQGMAKDPAARPTAAHFVRELGAIASRAVTTGGMASPPHRSRRALVVGVSAAAALAAVALTRAKVADDAPLPEPVVGHAPAVSTLAALPVPSPPPVADRPAVARRARRPRFAPASRTACSRPQRGRRERLPTCA